MIAEAPMPIQTIMPQVESVWTAASSSMRTVSSPRRSVARMTPTTPRPAASVIEAMPP